jgi:hypothetical protein
MPKRADCNRKFTKNALIPLEKAEKLLYNEKNVKAGNAR